MLKTELEEMYAALQLEHQQLKENTVAKARELSTEHGWCGVVEEALEDLGLVSNTEVTISFKLKFRSDRERLDKMAHREIASVVLQGISEINTSTWNGGELNVQFSENFELIGTDELNYTITPSDIDVSYT